jgi:hypothetical protein
MTKKSGIMLVLLTFCAGFAISFPHSPRNAPIVTAKRRCARPRGGTGVTLQLQAGPSVLGQQNHSARDGWGASHLLTTGIEYGWYESRRDLPIIARSFNCGDGKRKVKSPGGTAEGSAVPLGLVWLACKPAVETADYCQLFLRNIGAGRSNCSKTEMSQTAEQ